MTEQLPLVLGNLTLPRSEELQSLIEKYRECRAVIERGNNCPTDNTNLTPYVLGRDRAARLITDLVLRAEEAFVESVEAAERLKKTRLSNAQETLLAEMSLNQGVSSVPWGYRTAGRDASNWYRSADCLERVGLVVRHRGRAELTDAGRAYLARMKERRAIEARPRGVMMVKKA